jgi:hypothetical protein
VSAVILKKKERKKEACCKLSHNLEELLILVGAKI